MNKHLVTLCIALVVSLTTAKAQSSTMISRPRMSIERFDCISGIGDEVCKKFRSSVINALDATKRFDIWDVETQSFLDKEKMNRSSESAMGDINARSEVIVTRANNYILRGRLLEYSTKTIVVDGHTRYTYRLEYEITITDVAKSTDMTRKFTHGSDGQSLIGGVGGSLLNQLSSYASSDEALRQSRSIIVDDIKNMIIENLPLKGEIIGLDYTVKKDKLQTCYINIGCGLGVKQGDYFVIKVVQHRAGRAVLQDIGELKVKEIFEDDPGLAYCTVTKGGKAVFESMEEYQNLLVDNPQAQPLVVISTKGPIISFN